MTDQTGTESTGVRCATDTAPRHMIVPYKGNDQFFARKIYRVDVTSSKGNPLLTMVPFIYGARGPEDGYSLMTEYTLLRDLDSAMRDPSAVDSVVFAAGAEDGAHPECEGEPELFIHDTRTQGLTMNWRRARELYKKLMAE